MIVWDEVRDEYGCTIVNECGPISSTLLMARQAIGNAETQLRYGSGPYRDDCVLGQIKESLAQLDRLEQLLLAEAT